MILFDDTVLIPRLAFPMIHGFFIELSCLIEIYSERSGVFFSRNNEKMGMYNVNVFIVEFTAEDLKIDVHDDVFIYDELSCIYSRREMIEGCRIE